MLSSQVEMHKACREAHTRSKYLHDRVLQADRSYLHPTADIGSLHQLGVCADGGVHDMPSGRAIRKSTTKQSV